jgi:hypothetical protein
MIDWGSSFSLTVGREQKDCCLGVGLMIVRG